MIMGPNLNQTVVPRLANPLVSTIPTKYMGNKGFIS